jgi:hypothetical protein
VLDLPGFCKSSLFSVDNFVDSVSISPAKPYKSRLFLDCLKMKQKNKSFKINSLKFRCGGQQAAVAIFSAYYKPGPFLCITHLFSFIFLLAQVKNGPKKC